MNYKISWSQEYVGWVSYSEKLLELQVELSEFKDANLLIKRIKENLK